MSVHGLEIELKLNDYIQGEIREAVLYSEPWQLLEQLQERLKEARKDKLKRNRIKRLVDGTSSPKHIEKMKNPKMNWHIVRFIIRQRTYAGNREVLQFITYYFGSLSKGKSVLVLAHSNAAVDVLMSEVTKQIEKKKWTPGEIVRYGYSQHEHIRNHETLLASKLVETTNGSWGEERLYLEETRQDLREKSYRIKQHLLIRSVYKRLKVIFESKRLKLKK